MTEKKYDSEKLNQIFSPYINADRQPDPAIQAYDSYMKDLESDKNSGEDKPKENTSFGKQVYDKLKAGSSSLGEGMARMPSFVYDVFAMPQNYVAEKFNLPGLAASSPEWLKDPAGLSSYYNKLTEINNESTKQYDKSITEYIGNKDFVNAGKVLTLSVAETLPLMVGLMAGGAAEVNMIAPMTAYSGSLKKNELDELSEEDESKNLSEFTKTYNSLLTGLAEGAFEQMGTVKLGSFSKDLLEKIGKENFEKVTKNGFIKTVESRLQKLHPITTAIHEGIEESATQFSQNLTDKYTGVDSERNVMDGTMDAFLIGVGAGSAVSTPVNVSSKVINSVQKKKAQKKIKAVTHPSGNLVGGLDKDGSNVFVINGDLDDGDGMLIVSDANGENRRSVSVNDIEIGNVMNADDYLNGKNSQIDQEFSGNEQEPVELAGDQLPQFDETFQYGDQVGVVSDIAEDGSLVLETENGSIQVPAADVPTLQRVEQAPVNEEATEQAEQVQDDRRKITVNKSEIPVNESEDGGIELDQVYSTQQEAEKVRKDLEKRFPKADWQVDMKDSGDVLTEDEYRVSGKPKQVEVQESTEPTYLMNGEPISRGQAKGLIRAAENIEDISGLAIQNDDELSNLVSSKFPVKESSYSIGKDQVDREELEGFLQFVKSPKQLNGIKVENDDAMSELIQDRLNQLNQSLPMAELSDGMNPDQVNQAVLETSQNPTELALAYLEEQAKIPELTYEEEMIREHLGRIRKDGFERFGDLNHLEGAKQIQLNYFAQDGQQIDDAAQEISTTAGVEITEDNIIEFMKKFPNGPRSIKANTLTDEIAQKYEDITGNKLTLNEADRIIGTELSDQEQAAAENISDEYLQEWLENGFNATNVDGFAEVLTPDDINLIKSYLNEQDRSEETNGEGSQEAVSESEIKRDPQEESSESGAEEVNPLEEITESSNIDNPDNIPENLNPHIPIETYVNGLPIYNPEGDKGLGPIDSYQRSNVFSDKYDVKRLDLFKKGDMIYDMFTGVPYEVTKVSPSNSVGQARRLDHGYEEDKNTSISRFIALPEGYVYQPESEENLTKNGKGPEKGQKKTKKLTKNSKQSENTEVSKGQKESKKYGENNKLISNDQYTKLRERMKSKLNNLNSGFDPELLSIGTQMAMYHIESGARKFADFSKNMVSDLGEAIEPYLKSFYNGARDLPGMEDLAKEMDSYDTVSAHSFEKAKEIENAAKEVEQNPTEKQKEAGNYKKGHVTVQGLDIAIENPKGGKRSGVDPNGQSWEIEMNNHYGYFKRTKGKDGDHVDVFIGENPQSEKVFIVDQVNEDGSFDEHKVMLGFNNADQARSNYLANYTEGWTGLGALSEMNIDEFRKWLKQSEKTIGTKRKPVAELSSVKKEVVDDKKKSDNLEKNKQDVSNKSGNSEQDSGNSGNEVSNNSKDVSGERGRSGKTGSGSKKSDRGENQNAESGQSSLDLFSSLPGESSDKQLHNSNESTTAEESVTRGVDARGNSIASTEGSEVIEGGNIKDSSIPERSGIDDSKSKSVKLGQLDNIAATLPQLYPEQQGDVLRAEQRFFTGENTGKGKLFTNGTGTGKTFTGLGIAKRFVLQGKKNILFIVPTDAKAKDWINDGSYLELDITQLKDTKTAGENQVVTTYANFYQNEALQQCDFDLVIYDESHYLNQNEQGKATAYLKAHRSVSNLPSALRLRVKEELPEPIKPNDPKDPGNWATQQQKDKYKKELDKYEKDRAKWEKKHKIWQKKYNERVNELHDRTKVLFLSASPFAYHKNLIYGDGTLFDISESLELKGDSYAAYNEPVGFEKMLTENFGYRMRYNKVTVPESDVDQSLLERNFFEKLVKEGVVTGRQLVVDADYSREFVLLDSELSNQINEGILLFRNWDNKAFRNKYKLLTEKVNKKWNYLYMNQLIESIKAGKISDRIQEHLDLGRKIVLFHGYNNSLPSHPFRFNIENDKMLSPMEMVGDPALATSLQAEIDMFESEYPELVNMDLGELVNPRSAIVEQFGEQAREFNGTISKKKRFNYIKEFNDPKSGIDIMIVQRKAGKEGISLHDIEGNTQRVLIDLGLPTAPTDAIQTEGRIYRLGSESDAIFEYPVLHTDFEKHAFAEKVATRAKTAENLAMGNRARDLETAFKEGYQNAIDDAPNKEQGKGGKEFDTQVLETSEFDQAKTYYFARGKKTAKNKSREGTDYFATPEPVGLKVVEWLGLQPNESALEPSAGHGAIARFFPGDTKNIFVEPSYTLSSQLSINASGTIKQQQFEDFNVINKFDGIAMNPPFGSSGKTAMEHVEKAFNHLREGGRVVAIVPNGPSMQKRLEKFLYGENDKGKPNNSDAHLIAEVVLPQVTFERAGTKVGTKVIVIDKASNPIDVQPTRRIELDRIDNIGELFDQIEYLSLPERTKSIPTQVKKVQEQAVPVEETNSELLAPAQDYTNTKTKEELKLVKFNGRVEKDTYQATKSIANNNNGFYSRFAKGFLFKTGEDADKFRSDVAANTDLKFKQSNKILPSDYKHPIDYLNAVQSEIRRHDKEISETVNELAKELNSKIVAVSTEAGLPQYIQNKIAKLDLEGRVQGVFDPQSKTSYIIGSNIMDGAEARRVVLHEVVAHRGLRVALGDRFGEVLDLVYKGMNQSDIDRLAETYGNDYYEIAEEYIAEMAELDQSPTLLDKVIAKIRELIRKVYKLSYSDSEIRKLLAESKERLKAEPNPNDYTNANDFLDDMSVYNEPRLSLKTPGKIELLSKPNVAIVDVVADSFKTIQEAKDWARENLQGNSYVNADSGFEIRVGRKSLMKVFSGKAISKSENNQSHIDLVKSIPELIKESVLAESHEGQKAEKDFNLNAIHRFYVPIRHNGELKRVKITIKDVRNDGKKYYTHEVQKIELEAARPTDMAPNPGYQQKADTYQYSTTESNSIPVAKLLKGERNSKGELFVDDSDVRFKLKSKNQSGKMINSKGEQARENFQDQMLSVRNIQEKVIEGGGNVDDFSNPYVEENLSSSKSKAQIDDYTTKFFEPLQKAVSKLMDYANPEQIQAYMKAKHAPERNAHIRMKKTMSDPSVVSLAKNVRNLKKQYNKALEEYGAGEEVDIAEANLSDANEKYDQKVKDVFEQHMQADEKYSGMTDQEAQEAIDQFEKDIPESEINELWSQIKRNTSFTTERWFKDGFLSKDQYQSYQEMFDFYVPLRGWKGSEDMDAMFDYQNNSTGGAYNLVKKAEGRESEADDPLAYMASMAHTAIAAGNKNRIKQNALRMVKNNQNRADLFNLKKVYLVKVGEDADGNEVWEETLEKPDQEKWANGEADVVMKNKDQRRVARPLASEHEVEAFFNGTKMVGNFTDPNVANAVNKTNIKETTKAATQLAQSTIGQATHWLAQNFTSKNPAFIPINFIRDMGYSIPAHLIKHGSKSAALFAKNLPVAMGAIDRHLRGTADMNSEIDKLYHQFMIGGGETGFVHLYDIKDLKKGIEKDLKRLYGTNSKWDQMTQGRLIKGSGKLLEYMALQSENMARFSTYLAAIQQGKSSKEAAYQAKEITVNFNRKGKLTSLLGSLFAFFNATVQGSQNALSMAKRHKGKMLAVSTGFAVLGALSSAIARAFGGQDEDGEYYYDQLSDYQKYNNLVLPNFWGSENKFVTIPMPHFFRSFSGLGVIANEILNDRKSATDGFYAAMGNFADALSPINTSSITNKKGELSWRPAVPTVLVPIFDVKVNENFYGGPVFKEAFSKNMEGRKPESQMGLRSTNGFLTDLAEWLNEVGGGDHLRPAGVELKDGELVNNPAKNWLFDWNPSKAEHYLEYFAGGRGKFFNNVVKTANSVLDSEEEIKTSNVPVFRRLYQSSYKKGVYEDYFKLKDEFDQYDYYYKQYRNSGELDKLFKMIGDTEQLRRVKTFGQYQKQINRLNDRMKNIEDKETISELTGLKNKLMKDAVEAVSRGD